MLMITLQCCRFNIVISTVAVINNVKSVRLQRRHKLTDDACLDTSMKYMLSKISSFLNLTELQSNVHSNVL